MKTEKVWNMFIVFIVLSASFLNAEQSPIGVWITVDDDGKTATSYVRIYEEDGVIHGECIERLNKPDDYRCSKCEGDFKNLPMSGLRFMWDFKKTGNVDEQFGFEYAGGKILDPDNGKIYNAKIWRKDNVLTVRGYIAFLYRTQQWFLKD